MPFPSSGVTHWVAGVVNHYSDNSLKWIQQITTQSSIGGLRIELYSFSPDEFFDVLFSEWWLLEIEIERPRADGLLINVVKRRQVRVAKSLIDCKRPQRNIKLLVIVRSSIQYTVLGTWISESWYTCNASVRVKDKHLLKQIDSACRHIRKPNRELLLWVLWKLTNISSGIVTP